MMILLMITIGGDDVMMMITIGGDDDIVDDNDNVNTKYIVNYKLTIV